jgi:hypothetical protein
MIKHHIQKGAGSAVANAKPWYTLVVLGGTMRMLVRKIIFVTHAVSIAQA